MTNNGSLPSILEPCEAQLLLDYVWKSVTRLGAASFDMPKLHAWLFQAAGLVKSIAGVPLQARELL